ncbi:phage tail tape measure protein [Pseudomonas aeruginosa]|uniref:phage tail tape measure protein n=1 Tax=Pseudomonas aeruginosa TaxID=287 RepID=UPI00204423C3|nr:phage tail tape measure protein [Pseudomonas aeruginosa]ELK4834949.1 phage tail tape measure protein [Pseudomonas aeruginosa]MCM3911129.1 phage tail tape measure protein [Pseudomonas aeruginosa]MCM3936177.1 phage tail tape measure protein [Pseudomonas aeruginosa]MCM3948234.1 phage tail tape measure protein [Pseudomonas aeruginosa]MCM3996755.1 phage tail tape measure protein [Pseudomonas aeruginosa]
MSNFAELGIKVDSSPAAKAAEDLDKLVDSADQAEQAIDNLSDASKGLEQATKGVSRAEEDAARSVEKAAGARERQAAASRKVYDSAAGEISIISQLERALSGNVANIDDLIRAESLLERARKAGLTTLQDEAQYQDRLGAAYDRLQKAETKEAAEKQRLVAAQNRQIEAMQRTVNSIDPVTAALARLEKQEAALRGLRAAGGLDDAGLAAGLEKIAAKRRDIEGTGGAINKLGLTSKEARENVLQLGNALSTGNWRVAAHNIAEIGVNAGGAASGVIGVLAPIGLLAAAIGGVTAAAYLGSKEQGEYNKALIMTGNYAGTSASGLGEMARQVSNTVGTTGAAAEVLATLAGKGDLASESFVAITQAALSMEEATGRAVGDTVAEFVRLGEDPVKASKALNEQYNYLTASVYSQIKALEEQGDHAGAVKLATEAYADAINQRTPKILENLGWIERAWDGVARAAKRAWDDAKSIGRQDIDSQIADVERRLAQLDQGGFGLVGNRDESRNRLREELDMLRERKRAMEDDARTAGERARAEQAAQNAIDRIDARSRAALTNQQKRAKELEQYKKDLQAIREVNPNDDRLQQATIDREIANINAKYKDQKGSAGSVDLRAANAAKNSLAEITATYRNAQKELEASQRAGVISAESYAQQRIAIIQQERDEVTHAYEREIAALEAARAKQGTSAAQRIQLDQKIADARTAMVKAQKDADTELAILAANEDGRLARQKAATKAYVDQLERQRAALAAAGTRAANSLGLGDRQAGLQSSLDGATDRFNDERAKLLDRRRTAPDKYSQEDYKRDLVILAEAEDKYRDTVISNYDKITKAQGDWRSGASSAFQTYLESARDVAGQTKNLFTSAFSSMEDAVATFATTGKLSFSDFAKSILADMARIATRAAASQALSSLFGGFFGGGNAAAQSGVDNLVSNSGLFANGGAFAGGVQMFATGGAFTNSVVSTPTAFGMSGGRLGVMGEAGPEAVMPLTRTSSGALGVRAMGGGGSQINVEVNIASDGSANVSSSQPGLDQFGRDIGTFVEQKYRQLLARDLRRDGAIGRAING